VEEYHRTPAEAALRDFKDVFMVDKIVSGESDNDLKGPVSALRFRVSWVGFPGEDTVEQWKDIRNLTQLRTFLVEHPDKNYRGLSKKLPKFNRVEEDNEETTDEKPTDGVPDKAERPKKETREKKRKPIQVVSGETANIQGIDEIDDKPTVETSYELKNPDITLESAIRHKKPKIKSGKTLILRKSCRVKTRPKRLTRDEEGEEEVI